MALKRLSIAEMVKHSGDLVQEGSPERTAIEAVPEAAALMPQIQRAHDGLIAAQPPNDSEIAEITEDLGQLDAAHDDLVRALESRFASELALSSGADHDALTRAHMALLPDGLSVVLRSYTEQAGEAKLRAARVDDGVMDVLKKMESYDGRKLDAIYEELQRVATEIGAGVKRRAELGDAGERVESARDARNQWIRTINGLAAILEMVGVDEQPILGRIREAEIVAERRGVAPAPPADGPVVTDAPTPDAPTPDAPTPDAPTPDEPA